jgi:cytochrome c biogenesis protein CcmG, thiol:disulfide interchange protein DsbE
MNSPSGPVPPDSVAPSPAPSNPVPRSPVPSRRGPWRIALAGGLVVVAVVSVAVILRHSGTGPQPVPGSLPIGDGAPPVGRPAPEFSAPLMNGGTFTLRSLKGKPVVLNFWASWCIPCREETPLLVRLHKVYGPRGVQFVGLDTEDQVAGARAFIAQHHVDYPVARLEDERVIDAYSIPGLPTTVFIGADGVVTGKVVGGFVGPEGEKLLIARIDRLLADAHR